MSNTVLQPYITALQTRLVADYIIVMMPIYYYLHVVRYIVMFHLYLLQYHNVRLANNTTMTCGNSNIIYCNSAAAAALNVNQFSGLIHSKPFRDAIPTRRSTRNLYYNNKRIKPVERKVFRCTRVYSPPRDRRRKN